MTTVQQREQRLARVRQVGSEAADPERTALRAGPVSLFYEAGDLRYLCLEGREVVRRIYVAVRDRNWDTVRIAADPDAFTVSFRALHESGDLRFAWTGCIQGHSDGSLRFEMDGRALSTFLRNRIGFCILHPLRECVGQPCRFTTADGQRHTGSFPAFVSPHQPFLDLTAFAHPVRDGLWAELEFQGDLFEMEDHRNWTDGSFKTYCTPLRLPFPVAVPAGEPIRQAVTLTLHHEPTPSVIFPTPRPAGAGVQIAVGDPLGPLPHLGLEIAADAGSWSPVEAERFRALRLEHLRVSLDLRDLPAATRVLALAGEQADAAEAGLLVELRFPAAEEPDLAGILETARRLPAPILAWLV
ncbi:MAG: hypothetical protein FJ315_09235, partial [SAR202 cluster bacterium]|nr:hypothetical protein [SAR202 cluster bacterium]